jgi:hypothetical protein
LKIYIGIKEKTKSIIFESEIEPTRESHSQFDIIYGPFKSREDAQTYVNAMDQGVACSEG